MPHFELGPVTLLLAQIVAILLVARVLGVVTKWLGQPLVIAEILAGIVLGPSLLGLVWPEAMTTLFPESSLPILKMLSQVGLVLFMFLIGLELDPKLLRGRAQASVAISHTSIIVPFALGAFAAWWLHDTYSSPEVPFLSFVLFLGAAMSVTAFPVLARILSERHLLNSRVGAITVACAAVDDVTAWCILAFVVAVARAQGIVQALWTTGLAVLFILTMLFVVKPFLRRLGARVVSREGLTPTVVAIILLLLLVSSVVTEVIGIHALFGAFLFGAILPKEGRLGEALADKIESVAVLLLLPLFFAYSGLRTEIGLIDRPSEWLVAGGLVAVATLGKFGGSAIAARLTGLRWREASAIGILMNTRGLMELIVLNLGMDLGVISPTIFTMLVIMALVTTFATTPVLRAVYPDEELARDRLVEQAGDAVPGSPPPFTVMMCVSDATIGPGLAAVASALMGKRDEPARLFALHLFDPSDRLSVERRRTDTDFVEDPLAPLLERAREESLDVRALGFVSAEPAVDICRTAEAKQASLLLLGAHKPLWLEGRLSGTVSEVVERANRPVGVLVDRGLQKVERVLVAFAGGPDDVEALRLARRIAQAPGTKLTLLDVVEHTSPPEAVLEEAQRGYDLIVLGMNARWGIEAGMLSPKKRRVLSDSPVSILAVHPPLAPAAELADAPHPVPHLVDSSS